MAESPLSLQGQEDFGGETILLQSLHGVVGVSCIFADVSKIVPAYGGILCIALHVVRSYRTTAHPLERGHPQVGEQIDGDMEDLIERMSSLPLEEKKILYNEIARLIRQDIVKSMERKEKGMERMKLLLYDILGIEEDVPSSRERKQVVFRIILANLFLKMGESEKQVGRMMNKDHTTIHHYKVIMQDWFDCPGFYQEELSYWNQINAIL